MVEHVVLFKLKAEATGEAKRAAIEALKGLRDRIEGIVDLSCGMNFSERSQGYEIGLVVRFRDRAALDAYIPHPAHRGAVEKYLLPIREEVIAPMISSIDEPRPPGVLSFRIARAACSSLALARVSFR